MSRLHQRILNQGQVPDEGYHPHGTGATPMLMPLAAVRAHPAAAHSDVYFEELQPVIAADGAIIPARTGGSMADVIPAGRP